MDKHGEPPDPAETALSADLRQRRLRFHSESLAEPFRETGDVDISIEVDSVVHLDDGTTLQYWSVTHQSPEQVLATIESLPMTLDVRLLRTIDDRHWFEVHGSAESLFATFDEFDGVTQSATYDSDGIDVVAELPADVDTDQLLEAVEREYDDLELVDSYTVETLSAFRYLVRTRLTDRQFTVLQLAYFSGYYKQPRRRAGSELADRLDISRQAFHDHLRKAHRAVFEVLFDGTADHRGIDM